jgi:PAS domain S-box-containing protein
MGPMDQARASAAYLSSGAFFDAAPCGLHSLDDRGRFLAVNETELRWLGYEREELLGLDIAEVLPVESLPVFRERFEQLKRDGRSSDFEVQLVRRDGTRFPALISSSALRAEDGRFLQSVGVVHDLTQRKRHEQEESERSREASQREFVANVSHEFRTPLAAILGFAETLREGAVDNPHYRGRFLATIERHAQRLLGLVDNVLDVSARDAGRKPPNREPVAVGTELRRIARSLGPVARERRVRVSVSAPKDARALVDRAQFEQAVSNLIANAIKYNKRGGTVKVHAAKPSGGFVTVSVQDTGIGIAHDELPYVFDRFHRSTDPAARERKGSGLGLAITKQIARAHGGKVSVSSALGKGSTFTLSLPSFES